MGPWGGQNSKLLRATSEIDYIYRQGSSHIISFWAKGQKWFLIKTAPIRPAIVTDMFLRQL